MVRQPRYKWQLNGLLFGAAVGAGFAGFESAGYALRALFAGGWSGVLDSITIRALLSPGGHVIWTAMVGSALWRVKGDRPFATSMLTHPDVVRRWGIAVVLHGLWDADLLVHPYLKLLVLVVVGWYVVLAILKQALARSGAGPATGCCGLTLRLGLALALGLSSAACQEPARKLASGPSGAAGALSLVEALALRFGEASREPAFDALRPKLARAALVPSWIWDDATAWPRQGESWRAVEFAGYRSESEYRFGVRPFAPEPAGVGQYRGQLRLDKLAGGRFEWTVREELAVGALGPAELAAALDALLLGAEAHDETAARAAIAAAFPRASAKLGLLLGLEQLSLARDGHGATSLRLAVRLIPAGLRATAPRYAAFLDKYLTPIRTRVVATDATGATWWTLEGERNLWTLRLRARGGSLVPLEGDAERRIPERLRVTSDYSTRMGRFGSPRGDWSPRSRSPARLSRRASWRTSGRSPTGSCRSWWSRCSGSPLSYPFDGPGSEAGWAAIETASGTRFVRHYRARVAENFVLRWLGGMTSRALGEFRAGAEREADRYHGECLLALRDDLGVATARAPGRGGPRARRSPPRPACPRALPGRSPGRLAPPARARRAGASATGNRRRASSSTRIAPRRCRRRRCRARRSPPSSAKRPGSGSPPLAARRR